MNEKITRNRKKIISISIIMIFVLILLILSNVVKADDKPVLDNVGSTYGLGRVAMKYKENNYEFLRTSPANLFKFNLNELYSGEYGLSGNYTNGQGEAVHDIYWRSVICLFHSQSSAGRNGYNHKIEQVIDIETPGVERTSDENESIIIKDGQPTITKTPGAVTVYKFNKEDGKYSETVKDDNEELTVKYDKAEKNLNDFEAEEGRSAELDFKAFAYLMHKSTSGVYTEYKKSTTWTEVAIDWYWKWYIQSYVEQTGLLDEHFNFNSITEYDYKNEQGQIVDRTYLSNVVEKEINEAQAAAANILESAITKGNTAPIVEYVEESNKTYIGPLQVNYDGGTTSIIVKYVDENGEEKAIIADWVTKGENGEFSKVQREILDQGTEDTSDDVEAIKNITSGQIFYAVVDGTIKQPVTVEVKQDYDIYQARFVLTSNKCYAAQNLMFFVGKKDSGSKSVNWEIYSEPKLGDLIIYKKGENSTSLQGVEFSIWKAQSADLGYLRLIKDSQFVGKVDQEIDMSEYDIEYVGINDLDKATKFVTNAEGKIIIRNLEYSKGSAMYNYWVGEELNNYYGYKGMTMTVDDVTITGGTVGQVQTDADIEFTIGEEDTEVILTIQNNPELAPLEILKVDSDGKTVLENVKLKIEIGTGEYLQLEDANGVVTSVKGEVTINKNNVVKDSEYAVKYVTDIESATEFMTDKNGKIVINNLEVNASLGKKYTYTAREIENPNYGYGSANNSALTGKVVELKLKETTQIKVSNTQDLGNLELKKYDEDNESIILPDVGFAIELSPSAEKTHAYLALYNKDGKIVPSVKGTVTINSKNKAQETTADKQYRVSYYYSDKVYSELTSEEKANLTTFLTGDDGILKVNNLEVYSHETGEKYTYKLIETVNSNYGYVADSVELGNILLEAGKTTNAGLGNDPIYTKISGYVWIENPTGKANGYDNLYDVPDKNAADKDIKLTDLYVMENGELTLNENPKDVKAPVEIKLRDKTTGEFIKTLPDEFDANGKYTFVDVEIAKLANYEVVFVYNGFYYTTTVENLNEDNGSKVKEVATERTELNSEFETIKDNSQVVSEDGTVNTVEYVKNGHTSTVSKLNFSTTISANTSQTNYNLEEKYNSLKSEATKPVNEIDNINMGIVLREQPKISINSDIYSVLIDFEGYKYNYKYNGRQDYYENVNGDDIGVKFEQENTEKRYTRTVYASDIQAAKDQNKEIKVSITYKLQIANQSKTLTVMPKQIINYFDTRYEIKAVGLGLDETTHNVTNILNYSTAAEVAGHPEYKSTVIEFNQLMDAANPNVKDLYITFDVNRDAILDLLNNKSTYHNASEVLSYASYYGAGTAMSDNKQFISDITAAGEIYAGIDKMSQPGNIELKLVNHPSVEGTQILDTTNFEDDSTSAPSLLLEASESRKIIGTVWEDAATNTTNSQKLGNGIFEQGEKPIQNVKVELYTVDGNIAKYSNGQDAMTTTNENGQYTFGYYDEDSKKHVGILPGRYVIKYTYNNESYIVGSKNINVNDYKSTIITSEAIKNAFNGQNEKWYLIQEENRYSDARDDITLRPEYNPNIDGNITVTNSTYQNILSIESMIANTPVMNIGIEFTETDEADALTFEAVKELKNVDFGIVERPDVDINVEKQITGLEIIAQNGAALIPKGNPSDPEAEMQYVRTGLDGLVSVEIDAKLLQDATLNLEYTVTVKNNSDVDYLEEEYYYYGTGGRTERTAKVVNLVDYLDNTMKLVPNQNEIWVEQTPEYLKEKGLISDEIYNKLVGAGECHILLTEAFNDVGANGEESIKLYTTRTLAISDSILEENHVEIIEISGRRTIKESVPGNYDLTLKEPNEIDDDNVQLIITPPTGTTVNYTLYIIAAVATFAILVVGILIIKKKIIK